MRDAAPLLANCGPSRQEEARTSAVGTLWQVRPLSAVADWLEGLGRALTPARDVGREEDAAGEAPGAGEEALSILVKAAVPEIAAALDLTLSTGPEASCREQVRSLWSELRRREGLPAVSGIVYRVPAFRGWAWGATNGAQLATTRTWPAADPDSAPDPRAAARAAAVALLLPAVAVPPLLLWRRDPEPSWEALADVWLIREVGS